MKLTKVCMNNVGLIHEYSVTYDDRFDIANKMKLDDTYLDNLGNYIKENDILFIQENYDFYLIENSKKITSNQLKNILENKKEINIESKTNKIDTKKINKILKKMTI